VTHEDSIPEYSSTIDDPVVEQVLRRAREAQDLVNVVGDTTVGERNRLIAELDQAWPYTGQVIVASGHITLPKIVRHEGATYAAEPVSAFYDDEQVISQGFTFLEEPISVGEEVIATQFRVAHFLVKPDGPCSSSGRTGTALLDKVSLQYPFPSPELVENRLRVMHPDEIEELDSIVLNCDHEDDAVMAMKDFSVRINPSDEHEAMMVSDIEIYLGKVLDFDHDFHYYLEFSGECMHIADNTDHTLSPARVNEPVDLLAKVQRVRFTNDSQGPDDSGRYCYRPCVDVHVFAPDKLKAPTHLYIPVTSLSSFSSVRRYFYESQQQPDH
jgi:hypothetical protein